MGNQEGGRILSVLRHRAHETGFQISPIGSPEAPQANVDRPQKCGGLIARASCFRSLFKLV